MTTGSATPVSPGNGGSRPVPDPTVLTTEALRREVDALHTLMDEKLKTVEQRLEGMDEATLLRLQAVDEIPARIDEKVAHAVSITDEKFRSVDQRFLERDTRSERESRDNKVAVDAAFAAQKEAASEQNKSNTLAISKSETATNDTISKLQDLFATDIKGVNDKIDDLRTRQTAAENASRGREIGTDRAEAEGAKTRAMLFGSLAAIASVIGIGLAIFAATGR